MSVSWATTITGLSVLGEERLIAAEVTVGLAFPSHWIATSLSSSKYLEIITILNLLFS